MAIIKYQAHLRETGWQVDVADGQIAGTVGRNQPLEAIRITELNIPNTNVDAKAYVQDIGWMDSRHVTEVIGTEGQAKHMEGILIGLMGDGYNTHDIWYRCHVQDYGWLDWSCNGAANGTYGGNKPVEAIQIEIHEKIEGFDPRVQSDFQWKDLTPPPPPQPAPQANKREEALNKARSYVGYVTGTSEDSIFGRRYAGPMAGSWCCYAVRSICDDCGIPFPATGYVPTAVEWAQNNGKWTGNVDLSRLQAIVYDFNYNSCGDHIGLVENASNGIITALEGNTSGPSGEAIGYWRKNRSSGILGFINLT